MDDYNILDYLSADTIKKQVVSISSLMKSCTEIGKECLFKTDKHEFLICPNCGHSLGCSCNIMTGKDGKRYCIYCYKG